MAYLNGELRPIGTLLFSVEAYCIIDSTVSHLVTSALPLSERLNLEKSEVLMTPC